MPKTPAVDLLLIEDSPDHVELASRVFRKITTPLNIHIAQDGEEALNFIFGGEDYSDHGVASLKLIILDLYLPKMSGVEVLRRLRASHGPQSLPVAILTITGNERDSLGQWPFNVKHYLRKPLELNDFLKLYDTYIKKT